MALVTLTPGTVFARDFRVESQLNAGGMGAVYRVVQESTGRTRALKVMLPELLADPRARERFAQEARVGARIESEHVVDVVAAGVDDATGMPWLAMEHLEGEELAAVVARLGRIPEGAAKEVLLQVCDALGAAHRVGVVHCDLKPENVFLARARSRGVSVRVKVLDFGIARLVAENRASVTLTSAMGSPLFMAPEQGKRGQSVRAATDVWALGLLAFYVLTGRYYWLSANVRPADFDLMEQIAEVAKGELPSASERLRELGETALRLPAGFDAWFSMCVDRVIDRRFADGAEAGRALEGLLSQQVAVSESTRSTPAGPVASRMDLPSMDLSGATGIAQPFPTPPTPDASSSSPPYQGGGSYGSQIALPSMALPGVSASPPTRPDGAAASGQSGGGRSAGAVFAALMVLAVLGVVGWRYAISDDSTDGASRAEPPSPPSQTAQPETAAPVVERDATPEAARGPTVAAVVDSGPSCPEGMELIAGGSFTMGSAEGQGEADEHPSHRVTVGSFCMDRTEVTTGSYRSCVNAGAAGACALQTSVDWTGIVRVQRRAYDPECNLGRSDRETHPMNCVDWSNAEAYCRWRGARLPTEAEWEYAARGTGGQSRMYAWGDEAYGPDRLNGADDQAGRWLRAHGLTDTTLFRGDDGWPTTSPVGSYPRGATPEGLRDMTGNVFEWVSDWYGGYTTEASSDPAGPSSGNYRVYRGGSWDNNRPSWVRAADRSGDGPSLRYADLGFRCARGL